MARLVSLILLATLIVFLAITFFQVLAPFILPLFLAGVLAMLCQPIQRRFLKLTGQRSAWAAGLTTATVLTMLLVPLAAGMTAATTQLYTLTQYMLDSPRWSDAVRIVKTELQSKHSVKQVEEVTGQRLDLVEWRDQMNARRRVDQLLGEYLKRTGKTIEFPPPEKLDKLPADDPQFTALVKELSEKTSTALTAEEFRKELAAKRAIDDLLARAQKQVETPLDAEELDRQLQVRLFFEGATTRLNKVLPSPVDSEKLQDEVQNRIKDVSQAVVSRTLGAVGNTLGLVGQFVSFLISLITFVIAFFYFLADGPALLQAAQNLVPVDREYQRQLLVQFEQAVRAVVLATFAAALGQGIATGTAMYFLVSDRFVFMLLLSTVSALVPLLGTWLVWGPGAVWLAWNGHWASAAFLAAYGAFFVGTLDNVIRTYVLQSNVKLHPLLAFVSILGGLQVMGLWGLFIGPIVASCLYALVNIFNTELKAFSQEKFSAAGLTNTPSPPAPASPPVTPIPVAVTMQVVATTEPKQAPSPAPQQQPTKKTRKRRR